MPATTKSATAYDDILNLRTELKRIRVNMDSTARHAEKRIGLAAVLRTTRILNRIEKDLQDIHMLVDPRSDKQTIENIVKQPM